MQFVETPNLKIGMRLARPIYSNQGVLLFDRDSKLTAQTITSIQNFKLLGVFILEPAEPLPPISEEDLEYERFQTMTVFALQEEFRKLYINKKQSKLDMIANSIIRKYGHMDGKIHFYQNLRSRQDYVYRHSLNVAILCAMITHIMNVKLEEQMQTVLAALLHDIGKDQIADKVSDCDILTPEQQQFLWDNQLGAGELIESVLALNGNSVRRIVLQAARKQIEKDKGSEFNAKLVMGAKILLVANKYDEITAMKLGQGYSDSEVRALKEFMADPETYDPDVVQALIQAIYILFPGVSVELNTGEKALVLNENTRNILRPMVLCFSDNSILDLSLAVNRTIEIVDIVKTLDNRYVMMKPDEMKKTGE